MKTVEQLRKEGYKVKVTHRRVYGVGISNEIDTYLLSRFEKDDLINNRGANVSPPWEYGGETVLTLTTPDGTQTVQSTAECSDKDNFNRKKGLTIALGRALSQLQDK
jgi:hypothetical protein